MKIKVKVICCMLAFVISSVLTTAFAQSPLEQLVFSEKEFAYRYDGTRLVYNSAMYGYARKGYLVTDEIDQEHGNSLKIGMAETPTPGETSSPYVVISQTSDTNLTVAFSVYFSDKTDFRLALYKAASGQASSKEVNMIRWQDTLNVADMELEYDTGRWYRVVMRIDFENKSYTVQIDGETILEQYSFTDLDLVDSVRFYGHTNENKVGFAAVDDIELSVKAPTPMISGVGYNGQDIVSMPSAFADTLEIYLNTPLYNITEEQVHLYRDNKEAGFNRFGYDNTNGMIVLDVKGVLIPNARYTLVIDEDAELFDGVAIGESISGNFTTAPEAACLTFAEFLQADGSVEINAEFINPTGAEAELLVIAAVWEGDMFVKSKVFRERVIAPEEERIFVIDELDDNQRVELYVWDSFLGGEFLSDRVYRYEVK